LLFCALLYTFNTSLRLGILPLCPFKKSEC
jgi:hypothetical protein